MCEYFISGGHVGVRVKVKVGHAVVNMEVMVKELKAAGEVKEGCVALRSPGVCVAFIIRHDVFVLICPEDYSECVCVCVCVCVLGGSTTNLAQPVNLTEHLFGL